MQPMLRCVGLLLAGIVVLPLLAADPPAKKEKIIPFGEASGKLLKVNGGTSFTLEVTTKVPVPVKSGKTVTYQAKNDVKKYDLEAADDMVVRLANPPPVFNDKGQARKHTSKELAELKGKGNYPGYKGDPADLQKGQMVTVKLGRPASVKLDPKDKSPVPNGVKVTMIIVDKPVPGK